LARKRPLAKPVVTSVAIKPRALHAMPDHGAARVEREGPPSVAHAVKALPIRSRLAPVDHSLDVQR